MAIRSKSRFDRCVESVEKSGSAYNARGVCAVAGRRKYGKKKFAAMAKKGRAKVRKNIWPFSSAVEAPAKKRRSGLTIAQASRQAKLLGYRGGDFNEWIDRKGLSERSSSQLRMLADAYRQGIDDREIADRKKSEAKRDRERAAEEKRRDREADRAARAADRERDYHKRKPAGKKVVKYEGETITPTEDGYYYTMGSNFESLRLAKAFIRNWKKGRSNPSKRRNPAEASDEAYKDFHGKQSTETLSVTRRVHFHKHLAAAGSLRRLVVTTPDNRKRITIRFHKGTILAFNEDRNQLFIEGGDQSVDLKDFGITKPHEVETLGKVESIDYFTTKDHLGAEGGAAIYRHKFRTTNEGGKHVTLRVARCPDLIYRVRDKQMEFSGGSYEIIPEGIDR